MDKYYSMDHTKTRKQLLLYNISKYMLSYHLILYLIHSIYWYEEGITLLENSIFTLPERVWIDDYLAEIIIKPVNTIVSAIINMRSMSFDDSLKKSESKCLLKPHKSTLIIRFTILKEYFKALALIQKAPDCKLENLQKIKKQLLASSKLYSSIRDPLGDIEMMLFTLPAAFDDWANTYIQHFNMNDHRKNNPNEWLIVQEELPKFIQKAVNPTKEDKTLEWKMPNSWSPLALAKEIVSC